MNIQEALETLGIGDYAERIWQSNTRGELFHLGQYLFLAETFKDNNKWFCGWFEDTVKYAEQNWERPESVFQHILKILFEHLTEERRKRGLPAAQGLGSVGG